MKNLFNEQIQPPAVKSQETIKLNKASKLNIIAWLIQSGAPTSLKH